MEDDPIQAEVEPVQQALPESKNPPSQDPQHVMEYVKDIYAHMSATEGTFQPRHVFISVSCRL